MSEEGVIMRSTFVSLCGARSDSKLLLVLIRAFYIFNDKI